MLCGSYMNPFFANTSRFNNFFHNQCAFLFIRWIIYPLEHTKLSAWWSTKKTIFSSPPKMNKGKYAFSRKAKDAPRQGRTVGWAIVNEDLCDYHIQPKFDTLHWWFKNPIFNESFQLQHFSFDLNKLSMGMYLQ